jgi:putative copper export protein/mono/diheme cytochrome c family protein
MTVAALALAAARGLNTAGTLAAIGTLAAGRVTGRRQLLAAGVALAWLAAPVWLVLQAAEMAGTTTIGATLAIVPLALDGTQFGRALALRLALLAVALWLGRRDAMAARTAGLLAAGIAGLLQLRMGHPAAASDVLLPLGAGAHVLAAGVWIGGLPALWLELSRDAPGAARRFIRRGLPAVLLLAAGGLAQAWDLAGGLPGLFGTGYGHALLLKLGLFTGLLGCAALNRFLLTPRLAAPGGPLRLRHAVVVEAVLGLAAVLVAAAMAGSPPGAHEPPLWPLPWQLSLDAFDDDDLAPALIRALALLGAGAAIVLAAVAWRRAAGRLRLAGALAGLAMIGLAVPGLAALALPAVPTEFYESPTGFTAASIAAGGVVYRRDCAGCHGARGYGDGPQAGTPRPTALAGFHLLALGDGAMFWLISAGIAGTDGRPAMPGFADRLSEDERWAVIDEVRFLAGAVPDGNAAAPQHHH